MRKMIKVISVIAIIAGGALLLSVVIPVIIGAVMNAPAAGAVGIIGGADGPTAIMLAGVIGTGGIILEIVAGLLLVAIGIRGLKKR